MKNFSSSPNNLMKPKTNEFRSGFTLIEMLVSITIITVITSVVFLQSSRFNSSILLSNIAYEMALSIREAQVYGLSVRGLGSDEIALSQSQTRFKRGYGILLDGSSLNGAPLTSMALFADTYPLEIETGDKLYTGGTGGDAVISNLNLRKGYTITNFCIIKDNRYCYVQSGPNDLSLSSGRAVIYFLRPYPEAVIHDNTVSGLSNPAASAEITVSSPDRSTSKLVRIYQTGQIEVVSGTISNTP